MNICRGQSPNRLRLRAKTHGSKHSIKGPTHYVVRAQDLSTNIILMALQELQGDIGCPQVMNYNIQLIFAEWAAEVSEHFNMLLLKLLSSKRESCHIRKSFS